MDKQYHFTYWDYTAFGAIFVLSSSIGFYHIWTARKSSNALEFLVHNRNLQLLPLMLSFVGTFVSAVGILGLPNEVYTNGVVFMATFIPFLLIIPFGVYLFVPMFFNLEIASIFQDANKIAALDGAMVSVLGLVSVVADSILTEYFEYRYNRHIRIIASVIVNLQMLFYTSIVLYAPALALNQVTGLNLWALIASIGSTCIIYTALGGFKAVVWADAGQAVIMMTILFIVTIKGTFDLGGLSNIWRICEEGKRTEFFILESSPYSSYTFWSVAFGGIFHYLSMIVANQMLVQRFISNRTLKQAQICFAASSISISLFAALMTYSGLLIYARYSCDPILDGTVTTKDQLMVVFALEVLSFCKGFPGLFVGAIICATVSTMSSTLNSVTAMAIEDFIKPLRPNLTEIRTLRLSKLITVLYGFLCFLCICLIQALGGVIKATMTVFGITAGPLFSAFFLGMLLPWINSIGIFVGMIIGLALPMWATIGQIVYNPVLSSAPLRTDGCNFTVPLNTSHYPTTIQEVPFFYTISFTWYSAWSIGMTFIGTLIVTLITGPRSPQYVDSKLIFPSVYRLCHKLPHRWQAHLGFKVPSIEQCEVPLKQCPKPSDT